MTYTYSVSRTPRETKTMLLAIFTMFPLIVTATLPSESTLPTKDPAPAPELAPHDVVRIQVEALQKNNTLNAGISLTYRFASPDNKRHTGPLNRFSEMVRAAPYNRLLNHLNAQYGPLTVAGNRALQMVSIIDNAGEEIAYVWVLSLQSEGKFKNCWMTDAVIPAQPPARRDFT